MKHSEAFCLFLFVSSCVAPKDPDSSDGNEPGTSNAGSETTDGETPASAARTACEGAADEPGCAAAGPPTGFYCRWTTLTRAVRVDEGCETEAVSRCVAFVDEGVPPGCVAHIPGCDPAMHTGVDVMPVPMHREAADGAIELFNQCGNKPVLGFDDCTSGNAADAAPPECACVCELAGG